MKGLSDSSAYGTVWSANFVETELEILVGSDSWNLVLFLD
jgi:hypothetical protein